MPISIFYDKLKKPCDNMLSEALGATLDIWNAIVDCVHATCTPVSGEWNYYSRSAGWSYVLRQERHALLFLIPRRGFFKVSFIFGEDAVCLAYNADLPPRVHNAIRGAPPYIEGRIFFVDVQHHDDLEIIQKLLRIKHETALSFLEQHTAR